MARGSIYSPKALLFAMQEIPEHIMKTFGILQRASGNGYYTRPIPGLSYEIILLGDTIPDHIGRFIIFHYRDDYSVQQAFDLVEQIETLNPEADWLSFPVLD